MFFPLKKSDSGVYRNGFNNNLAKGTGITMWNKINL